MTTDLRKASFTKGILAAINEGTVSVPYLLLKYYKQLNLSDMEAMLLIQLMTFREKEQTEFPTIEQLQERMAAQPHTVIDMLQKLMKQQFITIEEYINAESGVQFERYNLQPTYIKIAHEHVKQLEKDAMEEVRSATATSVPSSLDSSLESSTKQSTEQEEHSKNIFTIFETEFARPLSPMEYETISIWLDQDQYKEELILMALREAVFAGKLHFRYIDRILVEWARQRIQTAEQARAYSQQFRGG